MRPRKQQVKHGEVEYKQTSGTAWSHSYLNQKPWHPLSYPNQRRKWIAEQSHAQHDRRSAEVSREFAQEQEFFQQAAQLSKKEKEKVEAMQAVSFMYMRPPGYNAESARAAEIADERKKLGLLPDFPEASNQVETAADVDEKGYGKKQRVKDVFGMSLATEEEFDVLKNAPRMDTGAPGRVRPFGVEIRNVKCARCGKFGHQSGDRECGMKDLITPNEEARLARDDPLNVIIAQTSTEPLKWELKQLPGGLSPARGGFKPEDPNQQIIPTDIFDEYGGFLAGPDVPDVLTLVSGEHKRKREKHREGKGERKKQKVSYVDSPGNANNGYTTNGKKRKHSGELDDSETESGGDRSHMGRQKRPRHGRRPGKIQDARGLGRDDDGSHRNKRSSERSSDSDGTSTSDEKDSSHQERTKKSSTHIHRRKRRRGFKPDTDGSDTSGSADKHSPRKHARENHGRRDNNRAHGVRDRINSVHGLGGKDAEQKKSSKHSQRKKKRGMKQETSDSGASGSSDDGRSGYKDSSRKSGRDDDGRRGDSKGHRTADLRNSDHVAGRKSSRRKTSSNHIERKQKRGLKQETSDSDPSDSPNNGSRGHEESARKHDEDDHGRWGDDGAQVFVDTDYVVSGQHKKADDCTREHDVRGRRSMHKGESHDHNVRDQRREKNSHFEDHRHAYRIDAGRSMAGMDTTLVPTTRTERKEVEQISDVPESIIEERVSDRQSNRVAEVRRFDSGTLECRSSNHGRHAKKIRG